MGTQGLEELAGIAGSDGEEYVPNAAKLRCTLLS